MSRTSSRPPRPPQLLSGPRAVHAQQLRLATLVAIAQDEAAARRRRARRVWGASVFAALSAVGIVFQSCAGSKPGARAADGDDQPLLASAKKSPKQAKSREETEELPAKATFDQAATDLQALFEAGLDDSSAAASGSHARPKPSNDEPEPSTRPSSRFSQPTPAAPVQTQEPAATPPPTEPAAAAPTADLSSGASVAMSVEPEIAASKTAADRRAELTAELAGLLKPQPNDAPGAMTALASLIALEAVQPGAATPEIEAALRPLSPDEAAAAKVARDIVRALAADSNMVADPAALRVELTRQLERLTASPDGGDTLTLNTLALCTRVESFGRYTPYSGNRFLAGRNNPAIVYVEVDHFTQRPMSELTGPSLDTSSDSADALGVELVMRAELFHDDGSRQWRSAEAVIRDTSRTRRRDFFLVQRIDLPANLSVGKYNLKVTVRDRLAGEGGAEAELAVPIQIVADAGLLGGGDPITPPAIKPVSSAPVAGPEPLRPAAATPLVAKPRR